MFPRSSIMAGLTLGGFVALDPTAASATATISNGGLTATGVGSANWTGARSVTGQRTGKHYFEVVRNSSDSAGDIGFGICGSTDLMNGFWPAATSNVVFRDDGSIAAASNQTGLGAWNATGDIACCAVDLDNRLAWFRTGAAGLWNASASANPATGVGGMAFGASATAPFFAAVLLWDVTDILNFNFTGPFAGTAPLGFLRS